jgi:hypothetical protein
MEEFNHQTIDPNLFTISDVICDNACFYRAIANYMYYATPHDNLTKVKRFYSWGNTKSVDKVNEKMGQYSETQNNLAEFIQRKIVDYVENHKDDILPQTGMSIENSIQLIHELTLDEYLSYYNVFAGDIDINQDLENEECYIDRWGSIIEQYVISKIIGCPIIVFNTQRYDTTYNKISNGKIINNKPQKGVRLKLSAVIGEEYIGTKLPVFLIWREYNKNGHYLVIYPNNPSTILSEINI